MYFMFATSYIENNDISLFKLEIMWKNVFFLCWELNSWIEFHDPWDKSTHLLEQVLDVFNMYLKERISTEIVGKNREEKNRNHQNASWKCWNNLNILKM